MAATPDFTTISGGASAAVEPLVWVRRFWGDPWRLDPTLKCASCSFCAVTANNTPTAALQRRYGPVKEPRGGWRVRTPLDLEGWYVRVEVPIDSEDPLVPASVFWVGEITEQLDQPEGAGVEFGGAPHASGTQVFGARDVGVMAAKRTPIDRSYLVQRTTELRQYKAIDRALVFNDPAARPGGDGAAWPNRQTARRFDRSAWFEDTPLQEAPTYWGMRDIIEYLVDRFPLGRQIEGGLLVEGLWAIPTRLSADSSAAWILAAPGASPLDRPVFDPQGLTLFDALAGLLDRRRWYGWRWVYDGFDQQRGRERLQLDVFRFNGYDIQLAGGGFLRKNPRRIVLDLTGALEVQEFRVLRSAVHQYDEVVAVGARGRSMFTVSNVDGNLWSGWSQSQETAYLAGASGTAGYGALPRDEAQRANEEARSDDSVSDVFARFVVSAFWDGLVKGGVGGPNNHFVQPGNFARQPMRALSRLPLPVGGEEGREYLRPLAFLKGEGDRWRLVDQVPSWAEENGLPGKTWTARVRPLEDDLGYEVRVSGAPQHVLGGAAELLDVDDATEADWATDLILTLAIETEQFAEGRWTSPAAELRDTSRTLRIDVGPAARWDAVVADTAIGVDGSGQLVRHGGGTIRDDRPLLAEIARVAGEWYLRERRAVEIRLAKIHPTIEVGQLLVSVKTAAGETPTSSVVTEVVWDFANQTTTIRTDFGELDRTTLLEQVAARRG